MELLELNAQKTCTKCGETKPLDDFGKDRRASDGKDSRCLACIAVGVRQWRAANPGNPAKLKSWRRANPEKCREQKLKKRYGLTLEQFDALLDKQKHKCAVCQKKFDGKGGPSLTTVTNATHVRGLLCNHCNSMGGKLKNTEYRRNEIFYVVPSAEKAT